MNPDVAHVAGSIESEAFEDGRAYVHDEDSPVPGKSSQPKLKTDGGRGRVSWEGCVRSVSTCTVVNFILKGKAMPTCTCDWHTL